VGAIGKVWKPEIPFVHVDGADAFAAFDEPGYVRVAWGMRVERFRRDVTRIELELRVDATDEDAWRKFRAYFLAIGPGSRFIRRSALQAIARDLEGRGPEDETRAMPGDELLPDATEQWSDGITIDGRPADIWPWLVQMGAGRAGFYSIDLLDNANHRSALEIHPDFQSLAVGDVIPARPGHSDGFEVLAIDEPRALVLGGLYDGFDGGMQLRFSAPLPIRCARMTWAFALEPLDAERTRLRVRVRADWRGERPATGWIGLVHRIMERAQLDNLAARVEQRVTREDWRDFVAGGQGAARIVAALLAPHRRPERAHWGLTAEEARRPYPGDDLVPNPSWGWTHAIHIDVPVANVWPWIAQIGADRAGFYSYQWLENLFGSSLRNAERVHPEWEVRPGDELLLHPKLPPLAVAAVEPGRWFVAHADDPDVAVSWLFLLEPQGESACRFVSRYRCRTSSALRPRLEYGPWLAEPLGFAMDRRMLLGVKERAERFAPASRS